MKPASILRVLVALVVSATMMMSQSGASAQTDTGFVWDAARTCSNGLALRWDQRGAETIQFSATDTSLDWTTGWIEIPDVNEMFHFQSVDQMFDKVNVKVTFVDGSTYEGDANTGVCSDKSNIPHPSLDDIAEPGDGDNHTPGGGGPVPHDGSYLDPVTGNAFTIVSAHRMCADNTLHTTFSGANMEGVDFMVYNPSPGWGTDWMKADVASGSFTTDVEREGAYLIDAGVKFKNGDSVIVNMRLSDCTPEVADGEIGESQLLVKIDLPGDADATGAPFDLYVPQAAVQFESTPYLSGMVGANSTITINGLIPGPYKLVVSPAGGTPIEAVVVVGDQPVTTATVVVAEDGTATVAYAGQDVPGSSEEPATTPGTSGSGTSSGSGNSAVVSSLPSTGVGQNSNTAVLLMAAATMILAGVALTSRYGFTRR